TDHVRWTGEKQKEDHTFDTELGTLPVPEIYGWKFNGWWTGKNGSGTKITEHSMVEPRDVVYYGSWEPVTYEVHLVSKTEQPDGESVQTFTINQKYDQEIGGLPIPEEKGYTFNGWYDADHNKINPHTIFRPDSGAEGYICHAEWKANSYKIRFVYTDADGKQKVVEIDRDYFMQLGTLPLPEKPGYTFAGWFNESGEKITSESWVEAGNVEYKAKWNANQYTIHFKSNSESISDPEDKTVTYALPIGDLPILYETGYAFLGWYTEPEGGIRIKETTLAALGDQTYYGHWSIKWIYIGNGTYRKPGADGKWNTTDDELWWYGPDGEIGTDDDRQIHIIPGGTGTYIENGDGTYITPGAGGSWENLDHWWRGPDGIIGTDDDRQIHIIPRGSGTYIDNGDGTYITPGAGGSWENLDHWWRGPDGIIGTDDDRQIHIIPGGSGTYIDNGDGTYITPGAGGSWENPDHWWYGPDGEIGTDDNRQIHIIPGGSGTYIDNGDGTYITPGADGSWENPDHWWRGPDGIIGTDDDRQIHIIPGGTGPYIDNGDGTYITPGADGSWENP
ncbi:InlB B-repeat-containing protein, partial [Lacrimispora amygdalina]|uniref:InlB B-repeat-containing protein n=1 Tax=Lacrimispora amygdalina TaxID=253257 RepID=UPI001407DD49